MSVPLGYATLGEALDSVQSDRSVMTGVQRKTNIHSGYAIQEFETDSTTVREFISPSGVVFAVSWTGPVQPDLNLLLGSYSSEYEEAKKSVKRVGHKRSLSTKANRVTVETWGHMRKLQGRAYLFSLLPAGFDLNEIK